MPRRLSVVALAVTLFAPTGTRAHEDETGIDAGVVRLAPSPTAPSFLEADLSLLELKLCGLTVDSHTAGTIVVTGDGGGNRMAFALEVVEHDHLSTGGTRLWVRPFDLALAGTRPLVLSCGSWTHRLELDPLRQQTVSEVLLVPDPRDLRRGTLSGLVHLAALDRFDRVEPGETQAVGRTIDLALAGAWALAPTGKGLSGDSNLVLFATTAQGAWSPAPSTAVESAGGVLVLEADKEVLDALNAVQIGD